MRKLVLISLIAALIGGVSFWALTPEPPKKVVPLPAPFEQLDLQVIPQEALSPNPTQSGEKRHAEAVEHPETYPSINELVLVTLDTTLGRPAAYEVSINRSHQGWSYVCGRPLELDKTAFDYTRSNLKSRVQTGTMDDMFCLLGASLGNEFELKEFSLGASDNSMKVWAAKHSTAQSLILGTIE